MTHRIGLGLAAAAVAVVAYSVVAAQQQSAPNGGPAQQTPRLQPVPPVPIEPQQQQPQQQQQQQQPQPQQQQQQQPSPFAPQPVPPRPLGGSPLPQRLEGPEAAPRTPPRAIFGREGQRQTRLRISVETLPRAPLRMPVIPLPTPDAAMVAGGYRVEVVATGLTYPTSVEFDSAGRIYVAESGFSYGDDVAPARVLRLRLLGNRVDTEVIAHQLSGPVNDLLWHNNRLYISHRGKISTVQGTEVVDLVNGLPSYGDHQNNALAVGPDGRIYFGQGTATNSGVVGLDNYLMGWLAKWPDFHDQPARSMTLSMQTFIEPDPFTMLLQKQAGIAQTAPFHPFGRSERRGQFIQASSRPGGAILRVNPDGSGLETIAWGLRNPFGLGFGPDGTLYATEAGADERGSRPVANAPDCLWVIRQGAFYGWPDFVAGQPVTYAQFTSSQGAGAPLQFLMADHPPVESPEMVFPPHTTPLKFDFSRSPYFGANQLYVALFGDATPATGMPGQHPGFGVARIDMNTMQVAPFFRTRPDALGPQGYEYVATAGPKRPIAVKFDPVGDALYVVDFGAMAVIPTATGPRPRPFPGTGTLWRIVPIGTAAFRPVR